eukprot:4875510-Amphidinium_carterae.1
MVPPSRQLKDFAALFRQLWSRSWQQFPTLPKLYSVVYCDSTIAAIRFYDRHSLLEINPFTKNPSLRGKQKGSGNTYELFLDHGGIESNILAIQTFYVPSSQVRSWTTQTF